jgi:hypothetical protein
LAKQSIGRCNTDYKLLLLQSAKQSKQAKGSHNKETTYVIDKHHKCLLTRLGEPSLVAKNLKKSHYKKITIIINSWEAK